MEPEKFSLTPVPAYEQHPAPETHQLAPMVPQNAYIQPSSPVPQYHAPPQPQSLPQPLSLPSVQEYNKAGPAPATGHPSGYNTAMPLHALQRAPAPVDCPVCGQREITRVEAQAGNTTHAWAAVLCCCSCLGCIPYMTLWLKDINHYCGKCGVMLATWHNSGRVEVHQAARN